MSRLLTRLAAVLAAITAAGAFTMMGAPAAHAAGLTSDAYFNDPNDASADGGPAGNYIRYLFMSRFNQAPAGSTARVVMYNIDDELVVDAMIAAKHRGVNVRVIQAKKTCDNFESTVLFDELNSQPSNGSWMICSDGSTRSGGGLVHQKSVTFSETGGTPYVTLVGSANMTSEAWQDQWTDMFQYADRKDVYDEYNDVFALQQAHAQDNSTMGSPYRTWTADDGIARANFYPVDDETPTSADDPVLTRLQNLPHNSNTHIVVANYSTNGDRGTWLVNELIALKNSGAEVTFISGPPTSDGLEDKMRDRDVGIHVVRGFQSACAGSDHVELGCMYIHLKAMVVSYKEDGQWNYRTYTGSDNWWPNALNNDEVTQRIGGERIYNEYLDFFMKIEARYGN